MAAAEDERAGAVERSNKASPWESTGHAAAADRPGDRRRRPGRQPRPAADGTRLRTARPLRRGRQQKASGEGTGGDDHHLREGRLHARASAVAPSPAPGAASRASAVSHRPHRLGYDGHGGDLEPVHPAGLREVDRAVSWANSTRAIAEGRVKPSQAARPPTIPARRVRSRCRPGCLPAPGAIGSARRGRRSSPRRASPVARRTRDGSSRDARSVRRTR